MLRNRTVHRGLLSAFAFLYAAACQAGYDVLNLPVPKNQIARDVYDLHTTTMWICVGIFIVVFGAMFYSILNHRRSAGHKAHHFHENTTIEIVWTIIPFAILMFMAFPATKTVLAMKDTSNPDMTVKVTAYQWKWEYDYMKDGVKYFSTLSTPREQVGAPGVEGTKKGENYLLEVDNPLVIPTGKKVRILVTSNDVIHGFYVPQLSVHQYGIPGFIKDAWIQADEPGTFRGQCSQICGKEHGFMPIVVVAKSPDDYAAWLKDQKAKSGVADAQATAAPAAAPASAPAPVETAAAAPAPAAPAAPSGPLGKILFAVGKQELPAGADAEIAKAAEFAKAHAGDKIAITGYTDKTGDPEKNKELAKERAKAVRAALQAAGVADDRIVMKPPQSVTGSGSDADARRVELNVDAPGAAAPAEDKPKS